MATMTTEPELDELLMRATRGLRRRWAASLEPLDLTPHHVRALRVIAGLERPRLGVVAERLRIAPRSATEVVDALEERGLVERVPDDADRRATCVVMTAEGTAMLTRADALRAGAGAEQFARLSPEERAQLAALLAKLDAPEGPPVDRDRP
jgi:DNA-binding MarR family transcriptional regulator